MDLYGLTPLPLSHESGGTNRGESGKNNLIPGYTFTYINFGLISLFEK